MGLLQMSELCEPMREEILYNENEKQMYCTAPARKQENRNISTNAKIIQFPAKRTRTKKSIV